MISDESLLEFAKEYGTPLYVYDGDLVVGGAIIQGTLDY